MSGDKNTAEVSRKRASSRSRCDLAGTTTSSGSGRGGRGRGCRVRGGRVSGGRGRGAQAEETPPASGVRVRGGGVTVNHPPALDDITIGMVEDLPTCNPMETPLHPKKRRILEFNKNYVYGSWSSWSNTPQSTGSVASIGKDAAITSTPRTQSTGSVTRTSKAAGADTMTPRTQPSGSLLVSPSPAEFVKCETSTPVTTRPTRSPLRDAGTVEFVNNGSEYDDSSEGSEVEDNEIETLVPRRLRVYLPAEEDTPEESEAAAFIPDVSPMENEGVCERPTSLYEFDWKAFPSTPISPQERRETFIGRCGPMIDPTSNPYDAFVEIWDRSIMEYIANQTNMYAQQYAETLLQRGEMGPNSRITKWRDTDADELYIYFALLITMGIVVKSKLENYWSNDNNIFTTPGFSANMSLRRFQLLSRVLHFNNNCNLSPESNNAQAKTFKIQPIVDHLNFKFSTLYSLGQNIALDESLTMWKGWLDIQQRIPNKAASIGIKTYEVCESRTGYLWRFEVHSGGATHGEQELITGAIPNLVLRLLRGLENRGHTVWMDNFYNSPALARILKTLGYDCVGTVRTNRQFVPQEITNLLKSDMRVGEVFGCTSGDVDLMVWRDKNRVAMISTYHGITVSENKPTVIHDYNVCMGGVDKKDQMIAMYPMERKRTHIWYKKFFRRLLNVSILNAYIIHKHFKPKTEHREFRMNLVVEILQRHQQRSELSVLPSVREVPKFSAEVIAHFPSSLPTLPGGEKQGKLRRRCAVCKKRTHVVCNACNVALCFATTTPPTSSCYIQYHS